MENLTPFKNPTPPADAHPSRTAPHRSIVTFETSPGAEKRPRTDISSQLFFPIQVVVLGEAHLDLIATPHPEHVCTVPDHPGIKDWVAVKNGGQDLPEHGGLTAALGGKGVSLATCERICGLSE